MSLPRAVKHYISKYVLESDMLREYVVEQIDSDYADEEIDDVLSDEEYNTIVTIIDNLINNKDFRKEIEELLSKYIREGEKI